MEEKSHSRSIYCDHCQTLVARSTYYRHRARYYNTRERKWENPGEPLADSDDSSRSSEDEEFESTLDDSRLQATDSVLSTDDSEIERPQMSVSEDESEDSCAEQSNNYECVPEQNDSSSSDEGGSDAAPAPAFHGQLKLFLAFIAIWQFAFNISNAAIISLLKFMRYFLGVVGLAFGCGSVQEMSSSIPITIRSLQHLIMVEKDDFLTYVVCPKCDSIYEYKDCYEIRRNGLKESKTCSHVHYPKHPHRSQRRACGATLLRKVRTKHGYTLTPIRSYPYKPIKQSIAQLVKRKGFIQCCENWRKRTVPQDILCDVYDGLVWKGVTSPNGEIFVNTPHCYLLTLNVDWFEPFERGVYSVGAIYLSIQNLPRRLRYKPENIMLVGVIPGPREPKKTINSYIMPLVIELREAWESGFLVQTPANVPLCIKLALSCVTCDIPATRKVCGFLSHNASLGCNKCLKRFNVQFGEQTDFSGFNRENWVERTHDQHLKDVENILKEVTKTGIQAAESRHGLRYSVLLSLPYFNPVRYSAIDVMHNLFLGTGKRVFEVWIQNGVLDKSQLAEVQRRVKLFSVPAGIGRLPCSIASCYGSFTANQWKNWITVFSTVTLKSVIPQNDFCCWLLFVRCCCILNNYCISKNDLTTADMFLTQFCSKFEQLYGKTSCSFNMHLHGHLKQIFLDYGPPHASWCFAFERFNGILGSYHTNNKIIESQIMRKFSRNQAIHNIDAPLPNEIIEYLPEGFELNVTEKYEVNHVALLKLSKCKIEEIPRFAFCKDSGIQLVGTYLERVFEYSIGEQLEELYKCLCPNQNISFPISRFYQKYGRVFIAGDLIGSHLPGANSKTSTVVMAYWPTRGRDSVANVDYLRMAVGVVQYFVRHLLHFEDGHEEEYVFAYVRWKEKHHHNDWFGISATVCVNSYESDSCFSFLPVQRIGARCATFVSEIDFGDINETVFIACPIPIKYYL